MNKVILCGRLVADPEVRVSQGEHATVIAHYTLAVDRINREEADFIRCVALGKNGEFAEKYLKKGMKILIEGRIQTGSYTDQDNKKVYTTDIMVERHEFVEKKESVSNADGFMNFPITEEEELPFGAVTR